MAGLIGQVLEGEEQAVAIQLDGIVALGKSAGGIDYIEAAAQEALIVLSDWAHNILAWTKDWMFSDSKLSNE